MRWYRTRRLWNFRIFELKNSNLQTMEVKELLRGGQFLVKEIPCDNIFTPEDFSEEQLMMRDAVKEFNNREVIAKRDRFEAKDYALTEAVMRKAGEMGFLGTSVPEAYGGLEMGFERWDVFGGS